MAFFLYDILFALRKLHGLHNDAICDQCERAEQLKKNVINIAWDGEMVQRACLHVARHCLSSAETAKLTLFSQAGSVLSRGWRKLRVQISDESATKNLFKRISELFSCWIHHFDKSKFTRDISKDNVSRSKGEADNTPMLAIG